jgi:hypothetical protein
LVIIDSLQKQTHNYVRDRFGAFWLRCWERQQCEQGRLKSFPENAGDRRFSRRLGFLF